MLTINQDIPQASASAEPVQTRVLNPFDTVDAADHASLLRFSLDSTAIRPKAREGENSAAN